MEHISTDMPISTEIDTTTSTTLQNRQNSILQYTYVTKYLYLKQSQYVISNNLRN